MKKYLLLALCLLSTVAVANAQRVDGCQCGVPAQVPDPFVIRHVDAGYQQAAMDAFNAWNTYIDIYRPTVQTGDFSLGNGINEIYFLDLSQIPGLDSSTAGFTPSLPSTSFGDFNECPIPPTVTCGNAMTEADVLMGSAIPWQTTRPAPGEIAAYYQATATHELGHALGFHHNWANYSEMNYLPHFTRFLSRTDILAARQAFPSRVLSVTDLATYPFTYDPTQQTGSGDGANAVTLVNFSPATVAPGGKVTINNWTVENLSNGPVSQVRLLLLLSHNSTTIDSNAIILGSFQFGSTDQLSTWTQDTTGHQFTIPSSTPVGQYYLAGFIGYVSGSNVQGDSISYNNSWVLPTPITVGSASTPTVCTPSSTKVCLISGRFQVSMTFNGAAMNANQFTDKTGLFSQTSDTSNIEVLLKMIDACSFNSKFWVYSGGTTDQAIVISVLDTRTGATKTYTNPSGTAFRTITDSSAFSCP